MDNEMFALPVSEETMASWLDGMMSPEEERYFEENFLEDSAVSAILDINDSVSDEVESSVDGQLFLPEGFMTDFPLPLIAPTGEDTNIFDDDDFALFENEEYSESEEQDDFREYALADECNYDESGSYDTNFSAMDLSESVTEEEEREETFGDSDFFEL